MKNMDSDSIRRLVQQAYGRIAINSESETGRQGCGCGTCGTTPRDFAKSLGYSDDELTAIPESANLALSCGNPTALAGLSSGETVLDLGAGAGFDCFLAADRVGASGRVIGLDMTPEMVEKARANAAGSNITNVEFRLGEIEKMPVEDGVVDVIISNCVINLSPDKNKVFLEMYRVLKPGGRIAISDIILLRELPDSVRGNLVAYTACISGASHIDEYRSSMESAGFINIAIEPAPSSCCTGTDSGDPFGRAIADLLGKSETLESCIASANITAIK